MFIDQFVLNFVLNIKSIELDSLAIVITNLGDPLFLGFICLLILFSSFRFKFVAPAIFLIIATTTAVLLQAILKLSFGRLRPQVDQDVGILLFSQLSFPSGHALVATVFLGLGAYFLNLYIKSNLLHKLVWLGASSLIILIGLSRIYLTVHWLSDVLFGWFLGLLVVFGFIKIYNKYRHYVKSN